MNAFSEFLRQASGRLPIPEPARSRVLLEIASDMEDLQRHYMDGGLGEEEAAQEVLSQFELPDEVLGELARIHSSPLQQSLKDISGAAGTRWERVLLGVLSLAVGGTLIVHLLQGSLYAVASPLVWLLNGMLAIGLVLGGVQVLHLFRPGAAFQARARKGLGFLLGWSLLLLGVGFTGVWVELYLAVTEIRAEPGQALVELVGWLHMASATLVIALSGALLMGTLWAVLEARASALEQKAAEDLLGATA
jgi:hypothetical protein